MVFVAMTTRRLNLQKGLRHSGMHFHSVLFLDHVIQYLLFKNNSLAYYYQSTEVTYTRKLPIFDICLQLCGICCHGHQAYEFAKRFIVVSCNTIVAYKYSSLVYQYAFTEVMLN